MVLGYLDSYMPKKKKNQLTLHTKTNSRWVKDLNISCDTIKTLEENIGRKSSDIPCSNFLTDTSPKAREIKEKNKKMGPHQNKKASAWPKKTALK